MSLWAAAVPGIPNAFCTRKYRGCEPGIEVATETGTGN